MCGLSGRGDGQRGECGPQAGNALDSGRRGQAETLLRSSGFILATAGLGLQGQGGVGNTLW